MVKCCKMVVYLLLLLLIAESCKNFEGTQIKGEISNLEYPYILVSYLSADTFAIDTISVDHRGKFNYICNIDTLTTFSFYLNNYESAAVVFADDGQKLTVKGDAHFPDLIRVNGNDINDDLTFFKSKNQDLLKQRTQLMLNMQLREVLDTMRNSTLTGNDEIAQLNLLNHELTLNAEDFIKEHPAKMSSLILINEFFTGSENPKALERVLGYMQGDIMSTRAAARLKSYSQKINRSAEGVIAPYFQLTDNGGKTIHPYDFSGKYLLLSFISTAGIESRETVSLLKKAYSGMNRDSVEFVSVYIDSDIYPIEYVENDSIPWKVVPEKRGWGSDIVDAYNVQYIPYNILIAPDGTIKARNIPAQGVSVAINNSSKESM